MTNNCYTGIPEDIKRQIDNLISKSNISANDFVKSLAKSYNVDLVESRTPLDLNYGDYWNSFID